MRNIKLIMAYRGTNYHGFQRQDNAVTVQGTVEKATSELFGGFVPVTGCSRTDTGVHANAFCFSVKTEKTIPCESIVRALNTMLPDDIVILSAQDAPADFHPRYSAVAKEYIYLIHNSETGSPFTADLMYHYRRRLDFGLFSETARQFEGTHDFAAFCSSGSAVSDTVRTIYCAEAAREGDTVSLRIKGSGFLYNMIRIIVGTLLEVNEGIISASDIPDIIASCDRNRAGRTAKAHGLYLNRVFY